MDYDDVMLYIKDHPDCSSLDLSDEFSVTIAKAFTFVNRLIEMRLVFRTMVRSPTNNKRIYGYRAIPGFDEVNDNGDGSMRIADVARYLQRMVARGMEWEASMHLASHNDWRRSNGLKEIESWEVFGEH